MREHNFDEVPIFWDIGLRMKRTPRQSCSDTGLIFPVFRQQSALLESTTIFNWNFLWPQHNISWVAKLWTTPGWALGWGPPHKISPLRPLTRMTHDQTRILAPGPSPSCTNTAHAHLVLVHWKVGQDCRLMFPNDFQQRFVTPSGFILNVIWSGVRCVVCRPRDLQRLASDYGEK